MLTDELVVVDGLIRTVDLAMTIYVDRFYRPREVEIIEKSARAATDFFLADNREFGERIWLEEINRAVFNTVDEVKISKIDNISNDIQLNFNEIIQLNNLVINISYV
jgi:hypothetical protein